jgi:hypothetical protein
MRRRFIHWSVGRSKGATICHPSQRLYVRVRIPTFLSLTEGLQAGSRLSLSGT